MSLTFVHGWLALAGLAAAAAPIVIHLLLKQQPRPIVFPALQFLQAKQITSTRKLKIRHWLLLALRMATLSLLGLALARPTLKSSLLAIDEQAPVSVALIIDASPSMDYRHEGKTRLEQAKKLAVEVLQRLPENSEVTLLESSTPTAGAPTTVSNAIGRLSSITTQAGAITVNEALAAGLRALEKSRLDRREVYVISDLVNHAVNPADAERMEELIEKLEHAQDLRVYFINVGFEQPTNIAIGELKLGSPSLAPNADIDLPVLIHNTGDGVNRTVTLRVDDQDRDSKSARLPARESLEMKFTLPALEPGVHQGEIAIQSGDNMSFDDKRYFTLSVHQPIQVLIASDRPADALHFTLALDPLRRADRPTHRIETVSSERLLTQELDRFSCVVLLNVERLPDDGWNRLASYVRNGGGLVVALGERSQPISYNLASAQQVLPARIISVADEKPAEETVLSPTKYAHPLLAPMERYREDLQAALANIPILKHWKVEPIEKEALTVVPLSTGAPAILERAAGAGSRGRCMLWTVAAHYKPEADYWSELPIQWPFVALVTQSVRYLAGISDTQLNVNVGGAVAVPLESGLGGLVFGVLAPDQRIERLTVEPLQTTLSYPSAKQVGQYVVAPADEAQRFKSGFSVNIPDVESDLTPVEPQRLEELVGKERCVIAADPSQLKETISTGRVGKELFRWLMLLVMLVICIEGYLANYFYDLPERRPSAVAPNPKEPVLS